MDHKRGTLEPFPERDRNHLAVALQVETWFRRNRALQRTLRPLLQNMKAARSSSCQAIVSVGTWTELRLRGAWEVIIKGKEEKYGPVRGVWIIG